MFVKPPTFNLALCFEVNAVVPLVFVLSAGSDPTGAVQKFGDDSNAKYNMISRSRPRAKSRKVNGYGSK